MKNILDKLGIKNLIKRPVEHIERQNLADYTAVNYELLRKREIEYFKMFNMLYLSTQLDNYNVAGTLAWKATVLEVIEEVSGKSWKEIKELSNG